MTISSITDNRVSYTGNGSTTAFSVTFPFFKKDDGVTHHLKVIKYTIATGAEEVLVENTGYTVTQSSGDPSTGTVTISPAISSAFKIFILSTLEPKQNLDLVNGTAVSVPNIEKALDRLTMLHQQSEEKLSRAVLLPETTTVTDLSFPTFDGSVEGDIPTVNSTTDGFVYRSVDELVSVAAFDINALTATATVDTATDYAAMYDTSIGAMRKVLVEDLAPPVSNPDGRILGSKFATATASQTTFTQNTWTDLTGLSVTYTPKKADSTIVIIGRINMAAASSSTGGLRFLVNNIPLEDEIPVSQQGNYTTSLDLSGMSVINEAGGYGTFQLLEFYKHGVIQALTIKAQAINLSGTDTNLRINHTASDIIQHPAGVSQIIIIEIWK